MSKTESGQNQSSSLPPPLWQRLVFGRHPKRTLTRAAFLLVTSFLLFKFVLLPVRISGISMEPAYHDHSFNFVNRLAYAWKNPRRGDVVALKSSELRMQPTYLKRIIGLPGETVAIERGVVLVDGRPLDEPYVKERSRWEVQPRKLELDEYLVIGDNRGMDQQSHYFGVIIAKQIVGKALW